MAGTPEKCWSGLHKPNTAERSEVPIFTMTLKKVRNQQIDFESAAGPALLIQSPAKSVRPEFKGRALPQKMYYSGANLSSDLSRPLWSLPDVSEQESDPSRSLTVRGDLAEKRDALGVSTESGDVVANPFDDQALIHESDIFGMPRETRKAEYVDPVVNGYADVFGVGEVLAGVGGNITCAR